MNRMDDAPIGMRHLEQAARAPFLFLMKVPVGYSLSVLRFFVIVRLDECLQRLS